MAFDTNGAGSGGFFQPSLPSPPLSTPSLPASLLPRPRATALRAGGSKESALRSYVDSKLLEISGRYERRFETDGRSRPDSNTHNPSAGYRSFAEMAMDLDAAVDIIWVSGTRESVRPWFRCPGSD